MLGFFSADCSDHYSADRSPKKSPEIVLGSWPLPSVLGGYRSRTRLSSPKLGSSVLGSAYRSLKHESTGFTPSELCQGRKLRLPLDLLRGRPPEENSQSERGYVFKLREKLVSIRDVVRQRLGIKSQKLKLWYDQKDKRLSFEPAVQFVLTSTFFTFNNKIYKQTFGVPMGSPLSPVIADIVMQDLESKVLNNINVILPFYVRYVDDIALAAPTEVVDNILNEFNGYHNRLQFTIERETNRSLNFLDTVIKVDNNTLHSD
ncbi:uncharacterized protein LOC120359472 [Solenopsis invicta]|uniref:uncharacterized protein LOC120359472 n=1 Tax=Solenopsis invicta TaxID=13686 RepID=UPI00193E0AF9|nr:uncharacterized protein LOC120359472 [Solenopsis invicta]